MERLAESLGFLDINVQGPGGAQGMYVAVVTFAEAWQAEEFAQRALKQRDAEGRWLTVHYH